MIIGRRENDDMLPRPSDIAYIISLSFKKNINSDMMIHDRPAVPRNPQVAGS
jgi:predicted nucleotide-binding protein